MEISAKIPGRGITYGEYAAYRRRKKSTYGGLFSQYIGANGETIDESNKGYTSAQIDYAISIFATCTNCTIDISGTNAHRTDASNEDLNNVLDNGNTITLNDVLGSEMIAAWNAAATWDVTDPAWTVNEGVDVDSDGNNGFLRKNAFWVVGDLYRIEYDVTVSGGKFQAPYDGSGAAAEGSSEATEVKVYYYSPDTSTAMMNYSNGFTGTLNDLSIKQVTFT